MEYTIKDGVIISYTLGSNESKSRITRINLSEKTSISAIGNGCFYEFPALTGVVLPTSLKQIRAEAFAQCPKLSSVNTDSLPELTSIGCLAFYGDKQLTSISFKADCKDIDYYAFMDTGIKQATIPSKQVSALFPFNYQNTITSITMADNSVIQPHEFSGCNGLTSEDSDGFISIDGAIDIRPFGLDELAINSDGNFGKWYVNHQNDKDLTVILGDNDHDKIAASAYEGNLSITKLTLNSQISRVGSRAFANCKNLTEVIVNCDLDYIPADAFEGCPKLSNVTATQDMLNRGIKSIFPRSYSTITDVRIQKDATHIPGNAFDGMTSLTAVVLEDESNLKLIDQDALPEHLELNDDGHNLKYITTEHDSDNRRWIIDASEYDQETCSLDAKYIGIGPLAFMNSSVKSIAFKGRYVCSGAFGNSRNLSYVSFSTNIKTIDKIKNLENFPFGLTIDDWTYFQTSSSTVIKKIDEITTSTCINNSKVIECGSKCKKINGIKNTNETKQLSTFIATKSPLTIVGTPFSGQTSLQQLHLTNRITFTEDNGKSQFSGLTKLNNVIVYGCSCQDAIDIIGIPRNSMCTVSYVKNGILAAYMKKSTSLTTLTGSYDTQTETSSPTTEFDITVNGIEFTVKDATEVYLNSNIKQIKNYSFSNCENLETITIAAEFDDDNKNPKIGSTVFNNCLYLSKIIFSGRNAKVTSIQNIEDPDEVGKTSFPWGYNGYSAKNVLDIVQVGEY